MILHVINGQGFSLGQVGRTELVSASEEIEIQRGQLLYVDSNGEFRVAGEDQAGDATTAGEVVYFALQGSDNMTAQMAGGLDGSQPAITGLSCTGSLLIETDMFDGELTPEMLLSVGENGKLVELQDGQTAVARCVSAPEVRWANDAVAVPGRRTGGNATVIRALTLFAPQVATA